MDLTQRQKDSASPTNYPTVDEIKIPDLLRWVAGNSAFEAGTPPSKHDEEKLLTFESQYVPSKTGSNFVTLSPSPVILDMGEKRGSEALEKEKEKDMVVGRVPTITVCKMYSEQYQLSGSGLRVVPPTWPRDSRLKKVGNGTRL